MEKTSNTGLEFLPYKFTAKELDKETGLYYYGMRYLEPKYSRWISTDPALGEYIPGAPTDEEAKRHNQNLPGMGGVFNTVNANLYHYAGNNPVKYTDPDGNSIAVGTVAGLTLLALGTYYTLLNYYQIPEVQEANRQLAESILLGFETAKEEIKNAFNNAGNCIRENVEHYNVAKAKTKEITKKWGKNKSTGSYIITFESGKTYCGKGGQERAAKSAIRESLINTDLPISIDWKPATNDREAFKDEYMNIQDHGGPQNNNNGDHSNYNRIQSPGLFYYYIDNGTLYTPNSNK